MLLSPTKNLTTKTERSIPYKSVPLHNIPLNALTPVNDLFKMTEAQEHRPHRFSNPVHFPKGSANIGVNAVNSTLLHGSNLYEEMPCELSSIAAEDTSPLGGDPILFPHRPTKNIPLVMEHNKPLESPAKIFARMKAKVQKQNLLPGPSGDSQSLIGSHCPRTRLEQHAQYHTPRKTYLPSRDATDKQEVYHDTTAIEVLTLSPSLTPGKVQKFQLDTSPKRNTPFNRLPEPNKVQCNAPPPSQLEQPIPSPSCDKSARVQARGERVFEKDSAASETCHDPVFAIPKVPVKRYDLGPKRKDSVQNSPAKIFAQMKERVVLQKRQELSQVSSTADVNRRGCLFGPCRQRSVPMSGDEADDELSRDVDTNAAVSTTVLTSPADARSSTGFQEPIYSTPSRHRPLSEPEPLPDLANDSLLQNSPRIAIPKKRATMFQDRHEAEVETSTEEQVPMAKGIRLREWQLKTQKSRLFVGGVRLDNKVLWHSNLIAERLSSNVLKTISGGIYILVGKMAPDPDSAFPGWFLKKFLCGFPVKWKDYLESYLSKSKSASSLVPEIKRHKNQSNDPKPSARPDRVKAKEQSAKTPKPKTPSGPETKIQANSAKLSRSGRLIKPPLEYWKGGRVVLDSDMNVTIHEDYSSTPTSHKSDGTILLNELSQSVRKTSSKGSSAKHKAPDRGTERTKPGLSDSDMPVSSRKLSSSRKQLPGDKASNKEGPGQGVLNHQYTVDLTPIKTSTELHKRCSENNLKYRCDPKGADSAESDEGALLESPIVVSAGLKELCLADNGMTVTGSQEAEPSAPVRKLKQYTRANKRAAREPSSDGANPAHGDMGKTRGSAKLTKSARDGQRRSLSTTDAERCLRPRTQSSRTTDSSDLEHAKGRVPSGESDGTSRDEGPASKPGAQRLGKNRAKRPTLGDRASGLDSESDGVSDPPWLLRSSSRSKRGVVGSPPKMTRSQRKERNGQEPQTAEKPDNSSSFLDPPWFFIKTRAGGMRQQRSGTPSAASRGPAPRLSSVDQTKPEGLPGAGSDGENAADSGSGTRKMLRKRTPTVKTRDEKASEDGPSCTRKSARKKTSNTQHAPRGAKNAKLPESIELRQYISSDSERELSDFVLSPEDCQSSLQGKKPNVPQAEKGTVTQPSPKEKREKKGSTKGKNKEGSRRSKKEEPKEDDDDWTAIELEKLHKAVSSFPKHKSGFWINVAMEVGTRSAEECQEQYTHQLDVLLKAKGKKKNTRRKKEEPVKEAPQITAKAGTLKRKQQMRNFLDHMPKDDHDDIFSSSPLQNKRVRLPALSTNGEDCVFQNLQQDPQTPSSSAFPSVKTPHCLHISPGMLGSVNRNNNDKYVYQLQKKMGKGWANVRGQDSCPEKLKYTPISSIKATKRRPDAENESFVVWKMFADKEPFPHPSDESGEEDYYFMDDD